MYVKLRYKEIAPLLYELLCPQSQRDTEHRLQDIYDTGPGVLQGGPHSSLLILGSPVQAPGVT